MVRTLAAIRTWLRKISPFSTTTLSKHCIASHCSPFASKTRQRKTNSKNPPKHLTQELSPMYRIYAHAFETIHDFFRGAEQHTSTQEISRMIRGVAKYVDGQNLMEYRMYRLQELVYELHALAARVRDLAECEMLPLGMRGGGGGGGGLAYSRSPRAIGYR